MSYPKINSVKELIEFCKRKRKSYTVILTKKFVNENKIVCVKCKKKITDENNRTFVYPKQKRIVPLHYSCAWDFLFNIIYSN